MEEREKKRQDQKGSDKPRQALYMTLTRKMASQAFNAKLRKHCFASYTEEKKDKNSSVASAMFGFVGDQWVQAGTHKHCLQWHFRLNWNPTWKQSTTLATTWQCSIEAIEDRDNGPNQRHHTFGSRQVGNLTELVRWMGQDFFFSLSVFLLFFLYFFAFIPFQMNLKS